MYIKNGIAYSSDSTVGIKVRDIVPADYYCICVKFNYGITKIFDFKPLLESAAFKQLANVEIFNKVNIVCGIPVWENGNIDISPEYLYEHGSVVFNSEL